MCMGSPSGFEMAYPGEWHNNSSSYLSVPDFRCSWTQPRGPLFDRVVERHLTSRNGVDMLCRLLLRLHELTYQSRNLLCFGIKREVSCVEYVDLRVRYVLAVAFRLAQIEREIVLAPEH